MSLRLASNMVVQERMSFWTRKTKGARVVKRNPKTAVVVANWKRKQWDAVSATQGDEPVWVRKEARRTLWLFRDKLYWEDEDLPTADVRVLLLQREMRQQQKLRSAHSLVKAYEAGRPTRVAIPSEVRRAVFERDGGRCVECDSNFDLQYDHVLPVALGGATNIENLQLLCADCNRRKSDSL